jgi:hypothetical protein
MPRTPDRPFLRLVAVQQLGQRIGIVHAGRRRRRRVDQLRLAVHVNVQLLAENTIAGPCGSGASPDRAIQPTRARFSTTP